MRWLRDPWILVGLVLGGVGIAIRIHNAFAYGINMGFDASFNWTYILGLMKSWALPAPEAGWSTAHPPFYYYASAVIGHALGRPSGAVQIAATRLFGSALGIVAVALAVHLVLRVDPGNRRRAVLAGGLLLFLPVHIYMSAMLNEEIVAAGFASIVVAALAWEFSSSTPDRRPLLSAAGIGLAAGLALLTKLTGVLVVCVAAASFAIASWRDHAPRTGAARIAVLLAVALPTGGWYFIRNWLEYGYLYPYALEAHQVMFTMPPGSRSLFDYIYLPLSTLTNPDLLSPELLRSVWGSTYLTVWFDGYRHFLAQHDPTVTRAAIVILTLALLPTAAFLWGVARGVARVLRGQLGADLPQLLLVAATIAGYLLFSWRNPWFATLKGSYLLGLSVPFAFYASETLERWTRPGRAGSLFVWAWLAVLVASVAVTFTFGPVFEKPLELPGIDWEPITP